MRQKCKKCEKEFDNNRSLWGHLSSHSRTITLRKYNCQVCDKDIFSYKKRKFCSLKCNAKINSEKRKNSVKYGLTIRELEEYSKNNIVCEICNREETTKANRKKLSYDHDHETGNFRGMLCFKCNTTFDYFSQYRDGFNNYFIKHKVD